MKDCIFCRIVEGKVPTEKIYEDNKVIAFLDISPVNFGHALIIPKKHAETIMDIEDKELCDAIKIARQISVALVKIVKADGINVSINNKKAAGQLVPHIHIHIIPRFNNDNFKFDWPTKKYADGQMEELTKRIRKEL